MAEGIHAGDSMPVVRSRRRRSNTKFIVGGLVFALALSYLIFSTAQSAGMYYLTIAEVQAGAGGTGQVRVAGKVVGESINYDVRTMQARFTIVDGAETLPVYYKGVLPDAFVPDADVVLEGYYVQGEPFQARSVLTMCASKYEPAEAAE